MKLKLLSEQFSVCKIADVGQVNWEDRYCFVGKTDEELSLVCSSKYVPADTLACEEGWRGFRIEGVLDFSLIGILAKISTILAEQKIGIFVVSTFNTDYILIKEEKLEETVEVLEKQGYSWEK
ncbi:MAG: ACT domain-containing protein [Cellulosilyticaceae bacterium]